MSDAPDPAGALVSYVADGATVTVNCTGCHTDARRETGMYAVTPVGPVLLGWFTHCPVCGSDSEWRCRYCGDRMPSDGALIHTHLRIQHATL